jgi:glycosyltransferase involved in cell wall biosynthesis
MEISITQEDLQKKKLFVATPMYGGMCAGIYTKSIADLSALCTKYGVQLQLYYLFNESLIPRARNYCCDEFMRSEATHFLFLDADIGFDPNDVIAMLAMQSDDSPYDILGAPYPKKCISWEKIVMAVNKGMADNDPNVLDKYVGDFVFNPKQGSTQILISEPCEVLEIGTGFMMVRRAAMVKFRDSFPQYMYRPDHVRTEHFDGSREIMMFFQSEIDPKSKRYLSEDYWFCQKCQEIDIKTFLCPWMRTMHVGSMIYGGSLADLASIGANPTADPAQLKKNREKK